MWWQARCTPELHHLHYDYPSDKYAYTSMNTMGTHTHTPYRDKYTYSKYRYCNEAWQNIWSDWNHHSKLSSGSYELLLPGLHTPTHTHTLLYFSVFSPAFVSHTHAGARWGKDEVNHICLIYIPVTLLKSTVGIRCVSTSQLCWKVPQHPDLKVLNNDSEDQQPHSACTTLYSSLRISRLSYMSLCIM